MSIKLNHTIIYSRDKAATAAFLADILGLPAAKPFGPFLTMQLDNEVTLDLYDTDAEITEQHYAFLVTEREFNDILRRIRKGGVRYWADPFHQRADQINTHNDGRGFYFEDPNGHNLEIITRPYGQP